MPFQIKHDLTVAAQEVLAQLYPEHHTNASVQVRLEVPKVTSHGDFSLNVAMQLTKLTKMKPRDVGANIIAALLANKTCLLWVERIEMAGPGFINLHLNASAKQEVVHQILKEQEAFGHTSPNDQHVIVEYVSANPTGPLHVGHARQAALGDALCNVLASQGWKVHREYYYNDAGVQIDTLTKSTQLRALGFKPGDPCWPMDPSNPESKAFYNGDYVIDIAQGYLATGGDVNDKAGVQQYAVAYLRDEQSKDLAALGVDFDNYYLESSLHACGKVQDLVNTLTQLGHTYHKDGALWLNTTAWGDSEDRVMTKSDGGTTYFVPDVAYHIEKYNRGFTKAINIQGSDHHGTVARVRAGLQAVDIGVPLNYPEYLLHTMVRVVKDGVEVKISKRAGSYVTLRDLIDWTSADAVRFMMLSRKADSDFTFDVDLALAQKSENPVFYVQYAYTRIQAVLSASLERGDGVPGGVPLTCLVSEQANNLMALLAQFPDVLANAAAGLSPHDITFYLRSLASSYHSYYDAERVLVDDPEMRAARVALVAATSQVLKNGLAALGIRAALLENRNLPAPA